MPGDTGDGLVMGAELLEDLQCGHVSDAYLSILTAFRESKSIWSERQHVHRRGMTAASDKLATDCIPYDQLFLRGRIAAGCVEGCKPEDFATVFQPAGIIDNFAPSFVRRVQKGAARDVEYSDVMDRGI